MINIYEEIEILEAYRDGKTIEFKSGNGWVSLDGGNEWHAFDFRAHDYRIVKTGEERLIDDLYAYLRQECAILEIIKLIKEGKYRDE